MEHKRITEPMDKDLSECWKIVDRLKGEAENIEKIKAENKELRDIVGLFVDMFDIGAITIHRNCGDEDGEMISKSMFIARELTK